MSKVQKTSELTSLILDTVVSNLKAEGVKITKKKLIDDLVYANYGHYYKEEGK